MDEKKLCTLSQAAEHLGVSEADVQDFINCGELVAVGSRKQFIRPGDLHKFLGLEPASLQNEERPVDFSGKQRSNVPHSILIEDILEKELETVQGKKYTPYFDHQRKRWCIALSLGKDERGKRKRKIISGKTLEEAKKSLNDYLKDQKETIIVPYYEAAAQEIAAQTPPMVSPEKMALVSDCYTAFLETKKSSIRNGTYRSYITSSRYTMEKLGHLRMCDLNRKRMVEFLDDLADAKYALGKETIPTRYYSQTVINIIFNLLNGFLTEYSDESRGTPLLEKNYMFGLKKPKSKAIKRRNRCFTNEEVQAILEAVKGNTKIYCWVYILAETGCRPSEALALYWDDIDFINRTISIYKSLEKVAEYDTETLRRVSKFRGNIKELKNMDSRKQGVDFQTRTIPVSDELLAAVKKLIDETRGNEELCRKRKEAHTDHLLFTGPKGTMWTFDDFSQSYRRLLEKSDLNPSQMNVYRFRHTLCTNLIMRGENLKTVQIFMGDNSPEMILRVYADVRKEVVLKSNVLRDRMADIMGRDRMEQMEMASGNP